MLAEVGVVLHQRPKECKVFARLIGVDAIQRYKELHNRVVIIINMETDSIRFDISTYPSLPIHKKQVT